MEGYDSLVNHHTDARGRWRYAAKTTLQEQRVLRVLHAGLPSANQRPRSSTGEPAVQPVAHAPHAGHDAPAFAQSVMNEMMSAAGAGHGRLGHGGAPEGEAHDEVAGADRAFMC